MSLRVKRIEKEKKKSIYNINWENLTFNYKSHIIKIVLEDNYPFQPPKLMIENTDHIEWFVMKYVKYKLFIHTFNIVNPCICCNSFTCYWVPTHTIDDLIREFIEYYDKYEILDKMYILYNKELFDNFIYENIFLYVII